MLLLTGRNVCLEEYIARGHQERMRISIQPRCTDEKVEGLDGSYRWIEFKCIFSSSTFELRIIVGVIAVDISTVDESAY